MARKPRPDRDRYGALYMTICENWLDQCIGTDTFDDAIWLVLSDKPKYIVEIRELIVGGRAEVVAGLVRLLRAKRVMNTVGGWIRMPDARLPASNRPATAVSTQTSISVTPGEAGL